MSIAITILVAIAGIVALFFLLALFMKKEYSIRREIVINKPRLEVFDYVKFLKNQDQYNKWVMIDPNMKKSFRGTDGRPGFVYAWDSENKQAGKGEQEIMKITDGERLDIEVRFERPFKSIGKTPMTLVSVSDHQTKVVWGLDGQSNYPLNAMNPFMDNLLGKDLETSLTTLKTILEKK